MDINYEIIAIIMIKGAITQSLINDRNFTSPFYKILSHTY